MRHLRTYARPPRPKRRSFWVPQPRARRQKRFYGLARSRSGRNDRRFGRRGPAAAEKSAFAGSPPPRRSKTTTGMGWKRRRAVAALGGAGAPEKSASRDRRAEDGR